MTNILRLILAFLCAIGLFSSCSKEPEGVKYSFESGFNGVTFLQKSYSTSIAQPEIKIQVARSNPNEEYTAKLITKVSKEVLTYFDIPSSVNFEKGVSSTYIIIKVKDFKSLPYLESYSFNLSFEDEKQVSYSGKSSIIVSATKALTWIPLGKATINEYDVLVGTDDFKGSVFRGKEANIFKVMMPYNGDDSVPVIFKLSEDFMTLEAFPKQSLQKYSVFVEGVSLIVKGNDLNFKVNYYQGPKLIIKNYDLLIKMPDGWNKK